MVTIEYLTTFITALVDFCTSEKYDQELWPGGPTGEAYLDGLVRVDHRGVARGSYVEGLDNLGKTLEFLKSIPEWEEFVPATGARSECRYYRAPVPKGYAAWQNVITMAEVAKLRAMDAIKLVDGKHGKEIVLYGQHQMDTYTITIIVEGGMMSTWYPGDTFAEIPKDLTDERLLVEAANNPYWAVKMMDHKAVAMSLEGGE